MENNNACIFLNKHIPDVIALQNKSYPNLAIFINSNSGWISVTTQKTVRLIDPEAPAY